MRIKNLLFEGVGFQRKAGHQRKMASTRNISVDKESELARCYMRDAVARKGRQALLARTARSGTVLIRS
jgi:hypothetical protein